MIFSLQTLAVLNPLKQTDHTIMQDTDLAGPLVFCLAFGGSLMLVSFPLNPLYSDGFSHTDKAIRMGLSIIYSKGSQVIIST